MSTPYDPHDPALQQPGTPGAPQPPDGQQSYAPPGGYALAGYLQGGSVGFGEAISQAFRNMFNYRGRASRSAFWWFFLFATLIGSAIGYIATEFIAAATITISTAFASITAANLVTTILSVLVLLPLAVRRLHDQDKSGFWVFIDLVPLVGPILLLAFLVRRGTPGPNRFG